MWAIIQRRCFQQHIRAMCSVACLYIPIRSSVRLNTMYAHGSNTWLPNIHCICSEHCRYSNTLTHEWSREGKWHGEIEWERARAWAINNLGSSSNEWGEQDRGSLAVGDAISVWMWLIKIEQGTAILWHDDHYLQLPWVCAPYDGVVNIGIADQNQDL